ncbi:probable receptor-like protein kinase at2g23200 [Phtheirospermum japonicum]|uniref:Probable receptor-like protein kinase at2g23200 n=1 Tax=Phtheirospermum japonicum TaxID=374723 RepID=A0A830B397_9LAMI|nr:probable receptor-like protein kinase at2g23200 [Phtheirospermum japonicum]
MDIFLFSFFLHLSSLFLPSATYTPDVSYFINCGSSSSISIDTRAFAGDGKPAGKFILSGRGSKSVENSSASDVEIYQTARIFRKPTYYEFDVGQTGLYVVRFHFYPFPSMGNLSNARFSVSASGFRLLSNSSVESHSLDNNLPLIQEFLLYVHVRKLRIDFVPYKDLQSFAFVNAIEVFIAPQELIPDNATHVTGEGNDEDYSGVLKGPLHVIHRINVGGPNIIPSNDSLLRYWIPDDDYLSSKVNAAYKNSASQVYDTEFVAATERIAPDFVYRTAKQLNIDDNSSSSSNISWTFDVNKGAEHLVRVHFCDIVSQTTNEQLTFNLSLYSNFSEEIYPYGVIPQTAAPFYRDFVVHSDDSGFLIISVSPNISSPYPTAFLNGVEIMELVNELAPASSSGGSTSKRKNLLIIIGSVVGGVVILTLVILTIFFFCLRKTKWMGVNEFDWPMIAFQGGSSYSRTTIRTVSDSPLADLNLGLKLPFPEILYATKRFNPKLMIGEGGFGKVYKGILRNGTKVAVKRSEPGHGQGLSEFETEIMVLSKIRHHHLVSLIGYCDEGDEMILVYEFMEKGTLQDHLYVLQGGEARESVSRAELSWDERLRICIGAAKGLNYLHTGSSGSTIIHRDIKSTNILLDEHFVAKVADFGLSRSGPLDQTHVSTAVKGSFGYLDPEYFKCLQLTQKSDVYSFGVVLLEVLCARPAISNWLPREQVNLADWAMVWQKKGELEKIIDSLLVDRINPNSLRKFGDTVEKCLQEYGADRPNMVDVLWDLEYCLQLQNTVVPREPYEDSGTDVSWSLPMPVVQRLPSNIVEDEMLPDDSGSFPGGGRVEEAEVFSQLKIDEAR